MQYTSHKVVYTMLPTKLQELPDSLLDNYIIQCIRQIDSKPMYENKLSMTRVRNGVAELPDDFIKSYGVYYNSKEPTEEEFNALLGCLSDDVKQECISDVPLTASTTSTTTNPTITENVPLTLQDRYKLVQIATQDNDGNTTTKYVMKGVIFDNYMASGYHYNCWTPLYNSDKLFTQCYLTKKSPCKVSKCDFRFSFDKCGHILTSLPDGWLKIAYVGRPTNEDGDYMIPDDMQYIKCLKDGVIMHYFEERRINGRQNSMQNHREYEDKFYNGVAGLRGSAMLPKGAVMDKQLRNIIYKNVSLANDYSLTGNGGYSGGTLFKHMR